ncbi:DNA N-glycosylase and apurinic/apyrimidinic (AP) lyase [Dissophora globulifera]|uniref:Endonuclease III homolog n=1 Tax=Dissophora globulifera TaxID=979702 RepID=A0A9P6V0H5_9FUNG|nr:DNA N-glycosylase and apurinic/apyrimidinic (AP) lyase [Dissophora globulifera]
MSARASSRLRDIKAKLEQQETSAKPSARKTARANATINDTKMTTDATNSDIMIGSSPSTTRSKRSTRGIVKNEDGEPDELTLARLKLEADEHRRALATEKREKRNSAALTEPSRGGGGKVKKEEQGGEVDTQAKGSKKSKFATKEPIGWEITLDRVREFRKANSAPVDTMGCERLAERGDHIPPEVSRFQTLMSLVLSSQTKDTVTSVAVWRLQKELKGGLTIQGILDVPSEKLNNMISAVGFHNKKTIYMKQVAEICKNEYNGDIPDTAEALMALPGVGPKMAYLTLQCAWNKNFGIGVDTHVHRIANRLGWVKTEKDGPEGTREALQSWLPKEHWREINYLLVGFGQVLCLPRGPLCGTCPIQERCPSATISAKQRKKVAITVKTEMEEPFGEVEIHSVHANEESKDGADMREIKQEIKQEDADQSPFFTSNEDKVVAIKEELEEPLIGTSNLDKEAADIEDLIT